MSYISRNPQFDCTRSVNLYPSLDEYQTGTNQQITQLLSTPGLTDVMFPDPNPTTGATTRGGWTTTTNQSFFVSGSTLYLIGGAAAPYAPQAIGTLLTSRGRVRAEDNGTQMFIVDGPNGYIVNLSTLSFQRCVDPAFYGSNFVEYYDGYFVFAKPGTNLFYWSDPNAVTFNALNFASKSGDSDPISCFSVYMRQLWLIGTTTSEIWYDVGGNVTFQRLAGPYIEAGCIAPDTLAKSESGLFWIAGNERGGTTVVMTAGNAIQKISTGSVDYQLQLYKQYIMKSTGYCYQKDGQLFYVLNPYNGTSSWVFDSTLAPLLGVLPWHERTYTVPPWESSIAVPNGTAQRHLADMAWNYNGQILVGAYNRPKVYAFDNDNVTDDGAVINRLRQAPHINNEGNIIFYNLFRLLAQVGVGTSGSTFQPNTIQHLSNTFTFIPAQYSSTRLGFSDGSIESPSFGQAYSYPLPTLIPSAQYQVLSLLNFEDGNNSTAFTDSANTGVVWTANAAAKESNTQIKYGTGSGAFLAANGHDYIFANAAVGTTLDLVTGQPDWTVESWVYPAGTSGVTQYLWDLSDRGNTLFQLYYNGTSLSASFPSIGMAASGQCVPNTWNHVAVTRNGNNGYLFINGKFPGPAGVTNDIAAGALPALSANAQYTLGALINSFGNPSGGAVAYIDDFRITKGRAIYAGNFTPPPQSLTTSVNFPYTVSTLLHFDDGANTFIDSAVVPNIYTAGGSNGTVSESSTQAKYGTGSLFSSGLDAHLTTSIANNAGPMDLTEATYAQDFTVEYFVYPTSNANAQYHLDLSGNNKTLFQTFMGNTGTINVALTALTGINSGATKISTNTWHHVAVEKKGLKYRLYVDGVNDSANGVSASIVPNQSNTANVMYVGSAWNSNTFLNGLKNGYLDELRIIKGQALYTANFAVPNTAFTTLGNPVLPNIGKIVVFQEGLGGGGDVAANLRISVASGSNTVNALSIDNVSFIDTQSNQQLYLSKVSAFSQGTSNTPADSTWVWTAAKLYFAWNVNTAYQFTVNYTTGSPGQAASPVWLTPQVYLSWSDDGGFLWSDEIGMDLGGVGRYNHLVEARGLGWGRNRVFRVRTTDPVQLNLMDASIEITPARA